MYFRKKGWHMVGIPAGSSVSNEISNKKESIHWLFTLDQRESFANSEIQDVSINSELWNRLSYTETVIEQTGLWVYYNPMYDYSDIIIDQSFVDTDISNSSYTIGQPRYIRLVEDISFTVGQYQYFNIKSDHVTFDGSGFTINIAMSGDNIKAVGVFRNGDSSDHDKTGTGYSNITIKNLNVNVKYGYFSNYEGSLCQNYFGKNARNILIDNCHIYGKIVGSNANTSIQHIGGLVGGYCCNNYNGKGQGISVNMTILNCSSNVTLHGNNTYCSLLVGSYSARYGGTLTIKNCFTTGTCRSQGTQFGGLLGYGSAMHNGRINIENCYTLNNIPKYSGGLFARIVVNPNSTSSDHTFGFVSVKNCYTLGHIICPGGTSSGTTGNREGGAIWPVNNNYEPYADASSIIGFYHADTNWSDASAQLLLSDKSKFVD